MSNILVEYPFGKLSLPRDRFLPIEEGSYYAIVETERHEDCLCVRHIVSDGQDDGEGGLWVRCELKYFVSGSITAAAPPKS